MPKQETPQPQPPDGYVDDPAKLADEIERDLASEMHIYATECSPDFYLGEMLLIVKALRLLADQPR